MLSSFIPSWVMLPFKIVHCIANHNWNFNRPHIKVHWLITLPLYIVEHQLVVRIFLLHCVRCYSVTSNATTRLDHRCSTLHPKLLMRMLLLQVAPRTKSTCKTSMSQISVLVVSTSLAEKCHRYSVWDDYEFNLHLLCKSLPRVDFG